ncbi:hypothetical protein KKH43_00875 [Patescibacteria group bacterium]|nr:hypothetical protein [Patescibacteria group bacterium]
MPNSNQPQKKAQAPQDLPLSGQGGVPQTPASPPEPKVPSASEPNKQQPEPQKPVEPTMKPQPQAAAPEPAAQPKPAEAPMQGNVPPDKPLMDDVLKPKEAPRPNPSLQKEPPTPSMEPIEGVPQSSNEASLPPEPFAEKTPEVPEPGAPIADAPLEEVPQGGSPEDIMESLSDKTIASSERKVLLYKIVTVLIVVLILGGLVFGGVFVYNRWVKPSLDKDVVEEQGGVVPSNEQGTGTGQATDLDKDGLPNDWETNHGLNPNDPADAFDDPDFDQLNNSEEYKYGSDPDNPDTDRDGFRDGIEVQKGYNPSGEGKIGDGSTTDQGGGSDFADVAGSWKGIMTGAQYTADDLEFTINNDGTILATYNLKRAGGGDPVFSRGKGTFTYSKSTRVFTSELSVKGFFQQDSVDYALKLNGQSKGDGSISGTWNLVPSREVPWLLKDGGTFTLNQ